MSDPSEERRYDRALLLGPKRNESVAWWEVERYGSDGFGDADYVCVYGLPPREWYGRGVRLLGRTVVECTRDRLAARISEDVAAVAGGAATGGTTVVVDPFAGSANTLFWLARRLDVRVAIGFELDDAVAAVTRRNVALLDLPIVVHHEPYERGIREIRADEEDLVVAFLAPPWGDALNDGELDLRRTTPPVVEALARIAAAFAGRRLLVAVQLYERVEPRSLAELAGPL